MPSHSAFSSYNKVTTQQDTGWGVIFRLNGLFAEIEDLSYEGKYDDWNIKLDRVWSNLVYRNPLEWIENDEGEYIEVKFSDEDIKKKDFLDKKILEAKKEMSDARKKYPTLEQTKNKEWIIGKKKLYRRIFIKEAWLRKLMHELGLYLKEVEYNPAGAMWGK